MKRLLLLAILFSFGTIQAQNIKNLINNKIEQAKSQVKNLNFKSGDYKFCLENKEINDLNQFEISHVSTINIKTNGNNIVIDIEGEEYDEGDTTLTKTVMYNSRGLGVDLGTTFDNPDSLFIFVKDSVGNWATYAKQVSDYNGNLVKKTTSYLDFGIIFGEDPSGLILASIRDFSYNGDKLAYTTNLSISFITGTLEKSDSITYSYTGNNLLEKVTFDYIIDSLKFYPKSKNKFTYNDKNNPISEENYNYLTDWVLTKRVTSEFDSKNREILSIDEKTGDNGANWIKDTRDSTIFDAPTMYLGFYNRLVSQDWTINEKWETSSISTLTDCGSQPDNTTEINKLDFDARFVNESLIIDAEEYNSEAVSIQLIDLQGRVIFNKNFNRTPTRIQTNGLNSGIYILSISSKDGLGSKKILKK